MLLSEKRVSTEICGVQANTIEIEEKDCRNNLGEEMDTQIDNQRSKKEDHYSK